MTPSSRRPTIAAALAAVVALVPASASLSSSAEDRTLPLTDRVSIAADGTDPNGRSFFPSISADGRFVAFHSDALNLVPGDTNGSVDAFVYDRETNITERMSVATDGTQGNLSSYDTSISADGRYVAFYSWARNLVAGDTNGFADVFVHNRQTGVSQRVSVASDGSQANMISTAPAISADGRFVVFNSFASNLVPGDTNGFPDVFVHDRQTGTTERVSVASDGTQGDRDSYDASISPDGRHVAFFSGASNLVPGDTNRQSAWYSGLDVFVHDRQTGATKRGSVASDGSEGNDNSFVAPASSFSADGRYVVFYSLASNLVPGDANRDSIGSPALDVFVHDLEAGSTERVSVASDATEGNSHSFRPTISADGRYVAFHSVATNLVPGDTNYDARTFSSGDDVFVHDRETGATERVSVASDGTQANHDSSNSAIGGDGRYVAFNSVASNLVPADRNGIHDVFVRDRGGPAAPQSRGTYPLVPDDRYFSDEWGLAKIEAPAAWQKPQATGFGIRVAVIDSGVDLQHRDLRCAGKLALGSSVLGGVVEEGYGADDVTGRGTHVAGIIGACTNNATGVAGVAPDATIVPYRVLSEQGVGSLADVGQAIRLATDSGAQVINLSLGPLIAPLSADPDVLDELESAIDDAASRGVVLVAPVAGDSVPLCEYPPLSRHVICVGATDKSDANAPYSTFAGHGDGPAVVAPGGTELVACDRHSDSILSLYPREFDSCNEGRFGYRDLSGTSMAAAHVSGIAALLYDRLGGVRTAGNAAEIVEAIVSSAKDLGPPGSDPLFGSGGVDALAAVAKVAVPTAVSFATSSASSGQYSDQTRFEARLAASDGASIAGRELSFELAGADSSRAFDATTDASGIAAIDPILTEKPGAYRLTVHYAGNADYAPSAETAGFTVEREESALALTVQSKGKNRTLMARLSDLDTPADGVGGRTISFYSDGKLLGTATTKADGVATFDPKGKDRGGHHAYEAVFQGDDYYLASSGSTGA